MNVSTFFSFFRDSLKTWEKTITTWEKTEEQTLNYSHFYSDSKTEKNHRWTDRRVIRNIHTKTVIARSQCKNLTVS